MDDVLAARSIQDLEASLHTIRRAYDAAHVVLFTTPTRMAQHSEPNVILTYPPSWVERYREFNYVNVDPVLRYARNCLMPFDWGVIDRSEEPVRRFFNDADGYGIGRFGLTLPIRGGHGERSLFTVTSNESMAQWQYIKEQLFGDMHLLGCHLHEQAMCLSGMRCVPARLSSRERQCLDLVAGGMLNKIVATRLDISIGAVDLYLASARRKLEAATTGEAIAKAISMELI